MCATARLREKVRRGEAIDWHHAKDSPRLRVVASRALSMVNGAAVVVGARGDYYMYILNVRG